MSPNLLFCRLYSFFPIFGRLICNGHFMQYIYKLNEWLFSVGIFFRFGKVNWKEEISNLVRVALWSITAGPRLGLIVPTRAQTRASHKPARCRFAFPQLTVHVRCLSYVLTTQLSHSPVLKRAFQTKFPEAWRSNLPFLYLFLLVKVQVCTTLTPQYLTQNNEIILCF